MKSTSHQSSLFLNRPESRFDPYYKVKRVQLAGLLRQRHGRAEPAFELRQGEEPGPVQNDSPGILAGKGSPYVTRPTLGTCISNDADLTETTNDLIDMVQSGDIIIPLNQTYALSDAVQAYRGLEARKTTGTTVFIP